MKLRPPRQTRQLAALGLIFRNFLNSELVELSPPSHASAHNPLVLRSKQLEAGHRTTWLSKLYARGACVRVPTEGGVGASYDAPCEKLRSAEGRLRLRTVDVRAERAS
eukprot:6504196-Pyramimonas_sp.AAC.1